MRTVEVPRCPICQNAGWTTFRDAVDCTGHVEGRFAFDECQTCRSWWLNPQPLAEEIPRLYPPAYYQRNPPPPSQGFWALAGNQMKISVWHQAYGYRSLPAPQGAAAVATRVVLAMPAVRESYGFEIRFLPSVPGGRVLDIGCNSGGFLALMRRLGWQTLGVELDPVAAGLARQQGLEVLDQPIEELEFPDESFEAITMHHVIEHLADPVSVLRRLSRWLKPGGRLVTLSPNPQSCAARTYGKHWRELDAPRHLVLPSPDGLRRLLEGAGLRASVSTPNRWAAQMIAESEALVRNGGRLPGRVPQPGWLRQMVTAWRRAPGEEVLGIGMRG
jgi:SAM-dependent methyltransferase